MLSQGAGIGLREAHVHALFDAPLALTSRPRLLEVHSENYFSSGGASAALLERAGEMAPLSLHGVGLSLGSAQALDQRHLQALRALHARARPQLVSEHLCWNAVDGQHFSDLLPLPRNHRVLAHLAGRIAQVQDTLGRQLLIEHLAGYLEYADDGLAEPEFLLELVRRSGCGLLLDLNNLWVSAHNLGFDPVAWLDALEPAAVGQYHLAGHLRRSLPDGAELLLDTHDALPAQPVWDLYAHALARFGPRPTIIEWDAQLPALEVLLACAAQAQACMDTLPLPTPSATAVVTTRPRARTRTSVPSELLLQQRDFAAVLHSGAAPGGSLRSARVDPAQALQIHRNNHQQHRLEALAAVYPVLAKVLGAECFRTLCWQYLDHQPMRSGNLLEDGEQLPALLHTISALAYLPWLSDLARLEWTLRQVSLAPAQAHPALTLDALASYAAEPLTRLHLQRIPACALFHAPWSLLELWLSQQGPACASLRAQPPQQAQWLLVSRPQLDVQLLSLSAGEYRLLAELSVANFGAATIAALAAQPDLQLPAALVRLLSAQVLMVAGATA